MRPFGVRKLVRVRAGHKADIRKYQSRADNLVACQTVNSEKLCGGEALLSTSHKKKQNNPEMDAEIELEMEDNTKLSQEQ